MKRVIYLLLFLAFLLTAGCGIIPHSSNDPPTADQVDEGPALVNFPTSFLGVQIPEPIEKVLCYDYVTLNAVLCAMNDADCIAGCNHDDIAGTLIDRLFPEVKDLPSVAANGRPDAAAAADTGAKYILMTDNAGSMTLAELTDAFSSIGIQPVVTTEYGERSSASTNAMTFLWVGTDSDDLKRNFDAVVREDHSLLKAELMEKLPFDKRRTVVFLGDTLYSVYTREIVHEIIEDCGGINAAADLEITDGYRTSAGFMTAVNTMVSPEQLCAWDPDVIWVPHFVDYTVDDVLNDPALANLKAVQAGAVYEFPGELEPWYYPTPSYRLGVFWGCYTLYPELCPYERVLTAAGRYYDTVFNAAFTEEDMGLVPLFGE